MGHTGRVIRFDNTSIVANPAALTSTAIYAAGFQWDTEPRRRANRISTSLADSVSSDLAIGTLYSVEFSNPEFIPSRDLAWREPGVDYGEDKWTRQRYHTSIGYGLFGRRLNLGVGLAVLNERRALRPEPARSRITLTAGVVAFPLESLGLQVSLQNFIPTKMDWAPMVLSAGAGFTLQELIVLEFDVDTDLSSYDKPKVDLAAGLNVRIYGRPSQEKGPTPLIDLRAGYYSEDALQQHVLTLGAGWIATRGKLFYSMGIIVSHLDPVTFDDKQRAGRLTHTLTFQIGI